MRKNLADLVPSGHGVLGTGASDRDAGGTDGTGDSVRHAEIFGDAGGEPTGKAIACADGIDRLDLGGGEPGGTGCVHEQCTLCAESDDGVTATGFN